MIPALFVGLVFGFTGYHFFVAPYILQQGLRRGMLMAAADLKEWLDSTPAAFKESVQLSMNEFNMNRKVEQILKQIGAHEQAKKASDVAPEDKET